MKETFLVMDAITHGQKDMMFIYARNVETQKKFGDKLYKNNIMSYTEFHKGKLRILTRSNEETINYIREHNIQDIIKEDDFSDGEIDFDTNNRKYTILHKDGIYYGKDCQHMLCEYIEHEEQEYGGDYYANVKRIGKDEYEFTLIFYNGGTCEEEILSEEISKLEKEPFGMKMMNMPQEEIIDKRIETYVGVDIILHDFLTRHPISIDIRKIDKADKSTSFLSEDGLVELTRIHCNDGNNICVHETVDEVNEILEEAKKRKDNYAVVLNNDKYHTVKVEILDELYSIKEKYEKLMNNQ